MCMTTLSRAVPACLLLSFVSSITPALADDSTDSLSDMVVTANRRESAWMEAPAMVTVISGYELEQAPEITVDDYLKRITSVGHSRTHIAECGPGRDITLRGIEDQKRTLVLVDGIPVNDGTGGSVNWSMIPKEMVERIEVVRGPMSALYGSGAMGGVINIITKKPAKAEGTVIKGSIGTLSTFSTTVFNAGVTSGQDGYIVGGKYYQTDGYVQAIDKESYYVENERSDISLLAKYYAVIDDQSSLTLGANYANEDYSRGVQYMDQINRTTLLTATYERELESGMSFTFSGYMNSLWREVDLSARPTYTTRDHIETDDTTKYGQLFQLDLIVGDRHTVSVGFDSSITYMEKENTGYSTNREGSAEGNQLFASIFAQDEMVFTSGNHKLLLTPGLRLDYSKSSDGKSVDTNPAPNPPVDNEYEDQSWSSVNPKLSLVDRWGDDTTLRVSVGRSFAAPTLFAMYTVFTRGPTIMYGNPELDPERAWSAELGMDHRFSRNLLLRLATYYTRSKDFISYRSLSMFENQADNITDVKVIGSDVEFNWGFAPDWDLHVAYTYNRSTVVEDEADPDMAGRFLPFVPRHKANIGISIQDFYGVNVDLNARYEGERFGGYDNLESNIKTDYVSLDLGLSGDFGSNLDWSLSFENLLDDKYDIYSMPPIPAEAPGLLVNGSLTYKF